MMSSGVSAAWPISCRITPRSISISVRIEGGVQHDIRDQVHRQRDILLQDARVIGRDLARGVGVDVAAHILDLLGDLPRCAARCP
jgi:hypothetical protein